MNIITGLLLVLFGIHIYKLVDHPRTGSVERHYRSLWLVPTIVFILYSAWSYWVSPNIPVAASNGQPQAQQQQPQAQPTAIVSATACSGEKGFRVSNNLGVVLEVYSTFQPGIKLMELGQGASQCFLVQTGTQDIHLIFKGVGVERKLDYHYPVGSVGWTDFPLNK